MSAPLGKMYAQIFKAIERVYGELEHTKTVWFDPTSIMAEVYGMTHPDLRRKVSDCMNQLEITGYLKRQKFGKIVYYALTTKGRDKCWQK